jgi:4-aminobutyrate aminotransferase
MTQDSRVLFRGAERLPVPGPLSTELYNRDAAVLSGSMGRVYPFVMERGVGCEVWDVDGQRYLDMAAGIAVVSTGHSHPQVVQAMQNQLISLSIWLVPTS